MRASFSRTPLLSVLHRFSVLILALFTCALTHADTILSHAIAMHGEPRYPADFKHFDYVSEKAVKGGHITLHEFGTFDSLNGFISKGTPAASVSMIYDTLTVSSADEPFTQYGLVAKSIEYPEDRSWVIFHLDERARFHDGQPITAEDVRYTFELLTTQGNPFFGFYYADVTEVVALDPQRVRFNFREESSHETLLIIGQLPVLPKHFWESRKFDQSSLEVPQGSGPYRIEKVDPGRSITLTRVGDYWAKDHPTHLGMYNFDRITFDYYRDSVVALEAFKAGEYDFRLETTAKLWATAYDGDALRSGRIKKLEIDHQNPTGMQGFIFNIRKPVFQDQALRQAITLAFDFEWTNRNLFYNAYNRTHSYFSNSELASSGLPSAFELQLLQPFKQQLPPELFSRPFTLPASDGQGHNRSNLRTAKRLLDAAGYRVVNNQLISPHTESAVAFELLLVNSDFERIANPFVKALEKLGINARVRVVDPSQFLQRRRSFDFDMISHVFGQSLSPGNEQRDFWHSDAAEVEGSRNLIGIQNPVVDALVDKVIQAKTRAQLVTASRALDRVLLNNYYVVPHWHINHHRVAFWDKFEMPAISPIYDPAFDTGFMTWWLKPEFRAAAPVVD